MRNWFNTFLSSPQDTKALFLSLSLLCLLAGTPLQTRGGLEFSWQRPCWSSGADEQPYHIVTATFTGADDTPADWRDAADIYKAWALNQEWCRHPFARREDLPAWLKDAPAMVRFGCELIQIDQVVGAAWPACYATNHGHPNGRGRWMTQAFATQLLTMRDAMRQIEPDAVVCFEEPNEWFNHLVGLQDYRDCEAPRSFTMLSWRQMGARP